MRANDLTGQTFGLLTAVKRTASREGASQKKVRWIVKCQCGVSTIIDAGDLTRTDSRARRTCGNRWHISGPNSVNWQGVGKISASYFRSIALGAKVRNLEFSITIEYINSILTDYCCISGLPISPEDKTASLDRIDSSVGYIIDNVQWVHKDINRIKSDLSQEYFISLCKKVASNNE